MRDGGGRVIHPIPPFYSDDSLILILGSFPSVRSREERFFYAHPRNRFWQTLARIFRESVPASVDEKKSFLLRNRIALWDVIGSCSISASSDASIRGAIPNDIPGLLRSINVKAIFTNGGTASKLYKKLILPVCGIEAIPLPSSSPANASLSADRLAEEWEKAMRPILSAEPGMAERQ